MSKENQVLTAMHDPGFTQEISFWLRILKEHALFIEMGLPVNRSDLAAEARHIHDMFQSLNRSEQDLLIIIAQDIIRSLQPLSNSKQNTRMILQCELAVPLSTPY